MKKKDKKSLPPSINDCYSGCYFSENYYVRGESRWSPAQLIEHCKENGYEPFDLPLAGINLVESPWGDITSLDVFIHHMDRILKTDYSYPIILDEYGQIADGYHRVCKAIINGETTIKAIRMKSMPPCLTQKK